MAGDPTPALTGRRRTRPTSIGCRNPWQPKPGRAPLIAAQATVQTNRATSVICLSVPPGPTYRYPLRRGIPLRVPPGTTGTPSRRTHLNRKLKTCLAVAVGAKCLQDRDGQGLALEPVRFACSKRLRRAVHVF